MSDRRWFLGLLLAWGLAAGMHLASPNRTAHLYEARLPVGIRYAFNADSAAFARIVVLFPQGLWDCEQGRVRILRPLYPALARLLYLPLSPLAPLVPGSLAARVRAIKAGANHPEIWVGVDDRALLLAWMALVALNLALYGLSSVLVMRALGRLFHPAEAFWLTLLAVFHGNAVDFILVPHAEAFNLLVPAVALDALTRGNGHPVPRRMTALLLGLLMLGKALAFPIVNWLHGGWRGKAACLALFLLPAAIYAVLLAATGLPLYNHEIAHYRQGVWMLDWIREGRAAEIPLRWAMGLAGHAANLVRGFAIPLLALACLLPRRSTPEPSTTRLAGPLLVYALSCAAFWTLLGYDQPRLSILHFPWVLAALGTLAASRAPRPARLLAAVAVLHAAAGLAGLGRS